jgi:hypothetical protein
LELITLHLLLWIAQSGQQSAKELVVRIHRCDRCGLVLDRDYNAALNILQRGIEVLFCLLPIGYREVAPVEIPCESVKQQRVLWTCSEVSSITFVVVVVVAASLSLCGKRNL